MVVAKSKILRNVEEQMFFYLNSTINHTSCVNYFEDENAKKYIGDLILQKYYDYTSEKGRSFVNYISEYVLDIALMIYEYKYEMTIVPKFTFVNDEARLYLERIYKDVEFLDNIHKEYWHICEHLVVFLKNEICSDMDFLFYMGKCYIELIVNGQYQNTTADKYLYSALAVLQNKYKSIDWKMKYKIYNSL